MTETILASSLLILMIFFLRRALAGRVSARLMYALWLIAAVRLLAFPVSLPVSRTSVVRSATLRQTEAALSSPVIPEPSAPVRTRQTLTFDDEPVVSAAAPVYAETETPLSAPETHTRGDLLRLIWCAGMLAAGGAVLLSNWRFARRLRRTRTRLELPARCPVYAAEGLPSPCLYGLLRPAIYLPPEMLAEETRLRHVLAHEETHFRHRDHIWALLRAACLIVHWFNPLVWLAAAYSRRDCELACDEGTLARLGEGERFAYGRTLVDVAAGKGRPGDLLRTATMMREGESTLAARVSRIAKKPQTKGAAVLALVTAAALACAGTFTSPEPEIISRELLAQMEAGCESDDPIERYVWRDLRDNGLPRYLEAVEQYEEEPVPIERLEFHCNPYLHARSEQYYAAAWLIVPEREVSELTKSDMLRYYTVQGDIFVNQMYVACSPWGEIHVMDEDMLWILVDSDRKGNDWENVSLKTDSTNFEDIANEFMVEVGMFLQEIADHNSGGITWFRVESVEVYDTIPDCDSSFAFETELRFRPVDLNNTHWMSGGGVNVNEDGTATLWREVELLRDEHGIWHCDTGSGGVRAPTEGTGWHRDYEVAKSEPLYTESRDPEVIARQYIEQYGEKLVALGKEKNTAGLRDFAFENVAVYEYEHTCLDDVGYPIEEYPGVFYAEGTVRVMLLANPMYWYWEGVHGMPILDENGWGAFRVKYILYQNADGSWSGVDYTWGGQPVCATIDGAVLSPDGRYAVEIEGIDENIVSGGIHPAQMLLIQDTESGLIPWKVHGYYRQAALWSSDSRYVALTCMARQRTDTIIVDTLDFSETVVPVPEMATELWEGASPSMFAQIAAIEWIDDQTLRLSCTLMEEETEFTYTVGD